MLFLPHLRLLSRYGVIKNIFLTNATCFLLRWSSEGRASTFPLTEWTPSSPFAASISQRSGSRRKINESRLCLVFFSKKYMRTNMSLNLQKINTKISKLAVSGYFHF
jgi:hypothetical protein